MMQQKSPQRRRGARAGGSVRQFLRDRRGAVSPIMVLCLIPLIGGLAMGTEVSGWWFLKRNLQNAADTAAIAAATTGSTTASAGCTTDPAHYDCEALAAAAKYGLTSGTGGVTVTPAYLTSSCPGGAPACYQVTVSETVPLYLTEAVGYHGTGGTNTQTVTATSVVSQVTAARDYCILALAGSGKQGIRTNGAPKANLAGCSIMSDTSATCNGSDLLAVYGDAHTTNNGCGIHQNSNMPVVADPYSGLASNIPPNPCGSYPQEPTLPASNLLSGPYTWSGNTFVCGDMQLTGNVTITTPSSGAVLVIENGQLDTNGFTFQTTSGSVLTVIFTGANGGYTHAPTGGGMLDIAAPSSGPWSGVALYQDPNLTSGVDISDAGNQPAWDITGLIYLPHASVTFDGAVNKSSYGPSCFALVVDNIEVSGTASFLEHQAQCAQAGLAPPSNPVLTTGRLLQ